MEPALENAYKFGLILLAAGLSRRMGGPNKLLQPYRGVPLLTHALKTAFALQFPDSVIVTGRDAPAIHALAASFGVPSVYNDRYEEGLGASLAIGAAALHKRLDGVFVALGDMPGIQAGDYRLLASNFKPGAIVVPLYAQSRGHPVLFCSSYISDLKSLSGDEGARSVLSRHAASIIEVETGNPATCSDIDRPEDFRDQE